MSKKLIALCACPMGLAHTFMAAQALEEAAVEAGYEVKIETQGADGIQNRLTAQDIAEATIIIHSVAVTPEDNERFESRDVYEITLQDAIRNAAGIIKEIEEMIASEQQEYSTGIIVMAVKQRSATVVPGASGAAAAVKNPQASKTSFWGELRSM